MAKKLHDSYYFTAADRMLAINEILTAVLLRHMAFTENRFMIIALIQDVLCTTAIETGKNLPQPDLLAATDRSCWMFELIDELLLTEPEIVADPTAKRLATNAANSLWKLYQHLGEKLYNNNEPKPKPARK